jgi:uncharacterized protein (TIGR02118 family)
MSLKLLGEAIKSVSIERGVEGQERGSSPQYVALCHFVCDSREAFEAAFFSNATVLREDMPRYTDIEPVIQISEIALQPKESQIHYATKADIEVCCSTR